MGQKKPTSSLTPRSVMGRAVSFAAVGTLLLAPSPLFAQSTSTRPGSSASSSQTSASNSYSASSTNAATTPNFDPGSADAATTTNPGDPTAAQNADGTTVPATAAAAANADTAVDGRITGSILDDDMRRLNLREPFADDAAPKRKLDRNITTEETPGIPLGTFVLRPTVAESINSETKKDAGVKTKRTFLETDVGATLTSDWALHQLTVTSQGAYQKNISGEGEEQPSFNINGDLRLDLPQQTTAHITGGYRFYREDTDDPNAIANASQQSDVQEFSGGGSIERDFGILRGLAAIDVTRTIYSDTKLSDGTTVTLSDRDQTAGNLRGRIGYELSGALIPFIEANVGHTLRDDERDSAGYARSGYNYGAKAGVQVDLGDKLKGEVALGYETENFDDDRLKSINSPTLDANVTWSPLRGTDVNFNLQTSIQPSTTPGESGYASHVLDTTITHQLRDNMVATFLGGVTLRDYPSDSVNSDETVYTVGSGLTWSINRYLDLTSTLGYELTTRKEGSDSEQWRAGIGLKLKR